MKNGIKKFMLAGRDTQFYRDNREVIVKYNLRILRLTIMVMSVITAIYAIFDLNSSDQRSMRLTYAACFLLFLCFFFFYEARMKKNSKGISVYSAVLYEFSFAFLLLVGPVFDTNNIAVYVPLFFVLAPILLVTPPYAIISLMTLDLGIFIAVDYICKDPAIALFDLINTVTCFFFGIIIGKHIINSKMSLVEAYNQVKASSESELAKALELANKDPLTGVKSRAAFESAESALNARIESGQTPEFAIVECDINYLKETNDNLGHDVGDVLIFNCSRDICHIFAHSPVYRTGGDEFTVILQGEDYANREELLSKMQKRVPGQAIRISSGMSVFNKETDSCMNDVFIRADSDMYAFKKAVKAEDKEKGISCIGQ